MKSLQKIILLKIREKVFGLDYPQVAMSFDNLAVLYHHEGKYAEAEILFKRSIKIWEKTFSPEHPNVTASLDNLAACQRRSENDVKMAV